MKINVRLDHLLACKNIESVDTRRSILCCICISNGAVIATDGKILIKCLDERIFLEPGKRICVQFFKSDLIKMKDTKDGIVQLDTDTFIVSTTPKYNGSTIKALFEIITEENYPQIDNLIELFDKEKFHNIDWGIFLDPKLLAKFPSGKHIPGIKIQIKSKKRKIINVKTSCRGM